MNSRILFKGFCRNQSVKGLMRYVLGIITLVCSTNLFSQPDFIPKKFDSQDGELRYQVLYPENFSEREKYPLVLFLHGAGERGSDNRKQLVHGSKLFLEDRNRTEFPAIIIFPQCPSEDYWASVKRTKNGFGERKFDFESSSNPSPSMATLLLLIDSLSEVSFIDQNRLYVMGLSMGGMGTFEIVTRRPNMFAAAVPICGGGDPHHVKKYAQKTKFWIFHGAKDNVVYPHYSVEMALALHKAGAEPRFTLYRNANHNSWDPAFAEPELFPWLFSQTKNY